jgi:hypothetical protein
VIELLDSLDALAELCRGAIVVNHSGAHVAVELDGGESITLTIGEHAIEVEFAGWCESIGWADDPDEREEAIELAVDFVAAAVFGELRVGEWVHAEQVARRTLEVRVDDVWRVHQHRGAVGLADLLARVRGRMVRRLRSNVGVLVKPASLRDAGPSGQPRSPWSGAGRSRATPAAEIAIDGELDLHNFEPQQVAPLVREYIEVCQQRGVRDLRIVHGKGKGVLRRTVHSLLEGHPAVESHRLGGHGEGSWGATIVRLRE